MKHYGFENPEGSNLKNITVPTGTSDPGTPNAGELFFRTDTGVLRIHDGTSWNDISTGTQMVVAGSPSQIQYNDGGSLGASSNLTFVTDTLGLNGVLNLQQVTAPGTTTDKLYNVGGDLFWNGSQLAFAASAAHVLKAGDTMTGELVIQETDRHLLLDGQDSGSAYLQIVNTTTGSTSGDGFLVGIDADEKAYLWNTEATDIRFLTASTEWMTLSSTGLLKLQTTGTHLHLEGNDSGDQHILITNTDTLGGLTIGITNTEHAYIKNAENSDLQFYTNNSLRLTLEAGGTLRTNVTDYETLVTADDDIPNKKFVDDGFVDITGDTMTGGLTIQSNSSDQLTLVEADGDACYQYFQNADTVKNGFRLGINSVETAIFRQEENAPMWFYTNDTLRFQIEADGTLHAETTDYENLITNDNDIPNKKYVDDQSVGEGHNLIINGGMQVWQRGTSFIGNGYTADRWFSNKDGATGVTIDRSTSKPTTQFDYSWRASVTTPNTGAARFFQVGTRIEGQDLRNLGWDFNSSSDYITLSFWTRSSLAGTYGVGVYLNLDGTTGRLYPTEFTINSADTWEQKTITIPGDTSVSYNTDPTDEGFTVFFFIDRGTNFTSAISLETWQNSGGDPSQDFAQNWLGTDENTFYLTGVKVEKGSVATDFPHQKFADELARCQRYYFKTYDYDITPGTATYAGNVLYRSNGTSTLQAAVCPFPVTMRVVPSTLAYNPANGNVNETRTGGVNKSVSSINKGERGISSLNWTSAGSDNALSYVQFTADAEL